MIRMDRMIPWMTKTPAAAAIPIRILTILLACLSLASPRETAAQSFEIAAVVNGEAVTEFDIDTRTRLVAELRASPIARRRGTACGHRCCAA